MYPTFVWLGFQVYRQFVCEEGFQDFCVGPILIANYVLISPQSKKIVSTEIKHCCKKAFPQTTIFNRCHKPEA